MKILIFFSCLFLVHALENELGNVPNSTIANFIIRPEVPTKSGPSFDFMPHFDHSSYEFMVPEGMNNEEATVAIVRFYGLLTEPNPEFHLLDDDNDWFKIGSIETVKETNYMVISVPLLIKKNIEIFYHQANQGMYSFKIMAKSGDFVTESDVNVEILSFAPAPETTTIKVLETSRVEISDSTPSSVIVTNEDEIASSTKALDSTTEEPLNEKIEPTTSSIKQEQHKELLTDVPPDSSVSKPISISMEELEQQLIHEANELAKSANDSVESLAFTSEQTEISSGGLQMPPINLQMINTKTQLSVESIEFPAIQNSVVSFYEIRVTLNDSVTSELVELKIEPEEYVEARPRFVLNRLPSQIKIKNINGIENVREIKITATYAEIDSDVKEELRILTKPVSIANPRFSNSKHEFAIPENSPSGAFVGEFHATDPSTNDDSGLMYSLLGKGSELFFVDAGKITLICPTNSTCLDREKQTTYYLIAFATNLFGRSTDPVTIVIKVIDTNDNPPLLQFPEKPIKISDGQIVEPFYITINDRDSDEINKNTLVFQGSAAEFLTPKMISERTFVVELIKSPEIGGYVLDVFAQDSNNKNLKSAKKSITIDVLNNSGRAKFGQIKYEKKIGIEVATKGTPLINTKFNGQPLETVQFVFLDKNPGWIAVDNFGGNVFINNVPKNGISPGEYSLTLAAVDRQTNRIIDRCGIKIIIEGNQLSTSLFTDRVYSFSLEKSKTSEDFSFSPLREKGQFEVVPESIYGYDESLQEVKLSPGVIKIYDGIVYLAARTLSRIRNIQFQLAAAENSDDRVLCTVYVLADVEKYEEERIRRSKPVFSTPWVDEDHIISINLPEETPLGHTILHLPAFDPESGEPIQQVTLEGEGADYFLYDPVKQSLLTNKLIDFETLDSKRFELRLTAKNQLSQTSAKIEMMIKNLDDNPPEIRLINGEVPNKPLILTLSENPPPGKILTKFFIHDEDNLKYSDFTYDLSGEYVNNFQVQGHENTVTLLTSSSGQFDYETDPQQSLLLTVKDKAGNSDTVEIIVSLIDENDNRPMIESSRRGFSAVENWPIGTIVGKISATDEDSGDNGRITFSISGHAAKFLAVDKQTGYLSTTVSLNGLSSSDPYKFEIIAMDHGSPNFTSTAEFEITVFDSASTMDGNNVEFRFTSPADDFVMTIPENIAINTQLLRAEVTGGSESARNIHYSLLPSDVKSVAINPTSGDVYVRDHLDFETEPYITVNILASDAYDSEKNTSRLLRIIVENVDDNEPEFVYHTEENGTLTFVVDDTIDDLGDKKIGKLQAMDLDAPPFNNISYYLFPCSETSLRYRVDRSSGDLFRLQTAVNISTDYDIICGLVSSTADLSEEIIRQLEFDPSNPSMMKLGIRDLSSMMDSEVNQQPKIKPENESIINIDGDGSSYSIPSQLDADRKEGSFLYKLQDVTYTPLGLGENGFQLPAVFVDPNTAEIRVDPEIVEFPEGVYQILIRVFYKKNGEQAGILVSQLHRVNRGNKLKFVFDEPPNELGLQLDAFKERLNQVLRSNNSTSDVIPIFSPPQEYSGSRTRSSVCFHLSRSGHILSVDEAVNITSTQMNASNQFMTLYQDFKVINIESCEIGKPVLAASQKLPTNLLLWIAGLFIGLLVFSALVCYTCFVARYRDNLQKRTDKLKEQKHPPPDSFAIPQFIDPRRL